MEITHDYTRYGPPEWPVFIGRPNERPVARALGREHELREFLVFGESPNDVSFKLGILIGFLTRESCRVSLILRREPVAIDDFGTTYVAVVAGIISFYGAWRPVLLDDYERAMARTRSDEGI